MKSKLVVSLLLGALVILEATASAFAAKPEAKPEAASKIFGHVPAYAAKPEAKPEM
jgi:hypothetical protein